MGTQLPHGKGHSSPTFRPMSIVVKRSPISATAELSYQNAREWRSCRCLVKLVSALNDVHRLAKRCVLSFCLKEVAEWFFQLRKQLVDSGLDVIIMFKRDGTSRRLQPPSTFPKRKHRVFPSSVGGQWSTSRSWTAGYAKSVMNFRKARPSVPPNSKIRI